MRTKQPPLLLQIHLALESAMQIVNSADRRLKKHPGAFLKCTARNISFNHREKLVKILYTQKWWDLWAHQENPSFHFLLISHSLRVCVLQAQSCPGEGEGEGRLCFCEPDNGVNNPEDLVHLTSNAYKSTNSRRPQRSQKVNEGGVADQSPIFCIFMDRSAFFWGSYKAVSAPRPWW